MILSSLLATAVLGVTPIRITREIPYLAIGKESLKLDVYRPVGSVGAPGVVLLHGGAYFSGNKSMMAPLAERMARGGLVVFVPNYRLAPVNRWPAMLDDAQTAVRFSRRVARSYGADPARFGAAGTSAGGHLALMLGLRDTRRTSVTTYSEWPSRINAILAIYPPTDFTKDFDWKLAEPLVMTVLGKPRAFAASEMKDASPVTHMYAHAPPLFLIHGLKDDVVPAEQSRRMLERYKTYQRKSDLREIAEMNHVLDMGKPEQAKAVDDGIRFLLTALGPPRRLSYAPIQSHE